MEELKFSEKTNFHDNIQFQNLKVGQIYTVHLNQPHPGHENLQKITGKLVGKQQGTSFTIETDDKNWHTFYPHGTGPNKINNITSGKLQFDGNGENNGTLKGLQREIMSYIVGPNTSVEQVNGGGKKSKRKTKNKKSKKTKTRKTKKRINKNRKTIRRKNMTRKK